jgi:hypothetical protein
MQRLLMKFPLVVILSSAVCFAGDYEDGTAAFDRGDYAIALKKLHPLAEQGNALAQNSLGVMYVEGKGVSQDYDEAIRWFRKAADSAGTRRPPVAVPGRLPLASCRPPPAPSGVARLRWVVALAQASCWWQYQV